MLITRRTSSTLILQCSSLSSKHILYILAYLWNHLCTIHFDILDIFSTDPYISPNPLVLQMLLFIFFGQKEGWGICTILPYSLTNGVTPLSFLERPASTLMCAEKPPFPPARIVMGTMSHTNYPCVVAGIYK